MAAPSRPGAEQIDPGAAGLVIDVGLADGQKAGDDAGVAEAGVRDQVGDRFNEVDMAFVLERADAVADDVIVDDRLVRRAGGGQRRIEADGDQQAGRAFRMALPGMQAAIDIDADFVERHHDMIFAGKQVFHSLRLVRILIAS